MKGQERLTRGAALLLLVAAGACASSSPAPEVVVAGEKHAASGQRLAVLWRDGVPASLPPRAAGDDAVAVALAIDGPDVYAAGVSTERVGDTRFDHPGYWRNGIRNELPTLGGADAEVSAVVAQGGVVRFGGAVRDPASGLLVPGIWTDGPSITLGPVTGPFQFVPLPVPVGAGDGQVLSLRLVDGVLLGAGVVLRAPSPGVEPERVPVTWRDGAVTELPLAAGAVAALAADVCVDRGVTLVVGHQFLGGLLTAPGYWRDGAWVELSRAAPNLPGLAGRCLVREGELVVLGGRVATVGPVWVGTAGVWRNGTWTTFSDSTHLDITMARDLASVGASLVVAGARVPGDVLTNSVGGTWTDTTWVALPMEAGEYGSVANAIAVRNP